MLAEHRTFWDLFSRDVWWAELWAAMGAIGWSTIAILSHSDVTQRPGLVRLASVAPDYVWETAGVVLGLMHLAALISGFRFARWSACFVMSWWWVFLTLTIIIQDPAAPSGALYVTNACICLTSLWKLKPGSREVFGLASLWNARRSDGR